MNFFKAPNKQEPTVDDCEQLSALGADDEAWGNLDDEKLKQVIGVKFIEYGATRSEPMRMLRQTSFSDYLEEIRPRLEALEADDYESKVIPRIFKMWGNAESCSGMLR